MLQQTPSVHEDFSKVITISGLGKKISGAILLGQMEKFNIYHIEKSKIGSWSKWEVTHYQAIGLTTVFVHHYNVSEIIGSTCLNYLSNNLHWQNIRTSAQG